MSEGDDKKDLSASLRMLALIVIIMINLTLNPQINISIIKLSFADNFSIGNYSYIWTLLCFLLFIIIEETVFALATLKFE